MLNDLRRKLAQQRHQLVPDPYAQETRILIGSVLCERYLVSGEVVVNVEPTGPNHRSQQITVASRHHAKSVNAGSTKHAHQYRLGPIFRMMRGRYKTCLQFLSVLTQHSIPSLPSTRLQIATVVQGQFGTRKWYPQLPAELPTKLYLCRRFPAQPVVY
jgi:hypothetical protein